MVSRPRPPFHGAWPQAGGHRGSGDRRVGEQPRSDVAVGGLCPAARRVPSLRAGPSIDVTRRLCADIGIEVAEIWAYHAMGDQLRFVLVQRSAGATRRPPEPPSLPRRHRRPSPRRQPPPSRPRTARSARRPANPPRARSRPEVARQKTVPRRPRPRDGAGRRRLRRPQAGARGTARNPPSRRPGAARPCPF